jgi:hypothetical protein
LLLLAVTATADEAAHYKSIVAIFRILKDGSMQMIEKVVVDAHVNQTIERTYWNDFTQHVTVQSIKRLDGSKVPFESKDPWTARWHGESDNDTFIIESRVEGVIIPAWGIPRAAELTHDESHMVRDPRDRLREILPIWRDAARNPRSRYLLDFQYEMPPPSEQGTDISFELYWQDGWEPLHTITGDTIVRKFPFDTYNSVRWRALHLFDVKGAPVADLRAHGMRMLAIAGFPVVCLLLWLLFVAREVLRRGIRSGEMVDDNVLRETIYNEAPEVIATRWSGTAKPPRIETFLRRLEKQHKLGITIEKIDDDTSKVSLRLLVSREQLSPYERAGIDALIPEGFEATSDQIQQRHANDEFDPVEPLRIYLTKFASENNGPSKSPWWSRLTSFAIFAYGFYLLVLDLARHQQAPVLIAGALIGSSMLTSLWPDGFTRLMVRNTLWAVIIPLIPIALASAIILGINIAVQEPFAPEATLGFSLVFLAVAKAALAASATRDPRTSLQRRAELLRARRWFQQELKSEHPRIRDDQRPWVEALGLRMRGGIQPGDDEDWGDSLVV